MQVEVDVPRGAGRPAAGAHEPYLAGTVCVARVREERVRRAGAGRQGHRADARRGPICTSGTLAGHDGTVVVSYRVFGDRIDGTYLARRFDARAHEHAGHADVGARLRDASGAGPVRTAAGTAMARGDAALSDRRSADIHRAQLPLPDGQPDGIQRASRCARSRCRALWHGRRRRSASRCITTAPTPTRMRLRRTSSASSARRSRSSASFRSTRTTPTRFSSDYLPWASGDGMEHRNSTVLTSAGALRNPGATKRHPRHRRARVLPLVEHGAHPLARSRALQLRRGGRFGRALVRRGIHQLLRRPDHAAHGADARCEDTLASFAGTINAVTYSPGRQFRSAEDMSRARAVRRCRGLDRSHQLGKHVHLVLHLRRRARACRWTCRCASCRTAGPRSTPTCRRCGRGSAAPGRRCRAWSRRRTRSQDLKDRPRRSQRRQEICRDLLRRVHPGPRRRQLRAAARARGPDAAQDEPGQGVPRRHHRSASRAAPVRASAGAVAFGTALYKAGVDRDDLHRFDRRRHVHLAGCARRSVLAAHKPGDQVR